MDFLEGDQLYWKQTFKVELTDTLSKTLRVFFFFPLSPPTLLPALPKLSGSFHVANISQELSVALLYNLILTHILLVSCYYCYFSGQETLKFKDFCVNLAFFLTELKKTPYLSSFDI